MFHFVFSFLVVFSFFYVSFCVFFLIKCVLPFYFWQVKFPAVFRWPQYKLSIRVVPEES